MFQRPVLFVVSAALGDVQFLLDDPVRTGLIPVHVERFQNELLIFGKLRPGGIKPRHVFNSLPVPFLQNVDL